MGDGLFGFLARITDLNVRQAIRGVADRLGALEATVTRIDQTALKTGSPVDAYGQRIKQVADPQRDNDAATQGYVRKYVHAVIQAQEPVPAPRRDAGGTPTIPPPVGTFTATPDSLPAGGGNVTFQWSSQYADTVEASGFGALPLSGSAVLLVTTSTTYTLILRGPGGISHYSVVVTVDTTPAPTPAPTGTFQAIPSTITPGAAATLTWTSSNTTQASISPGIGVLATPSSGTIAVQPSGTTTYELRLEGPGGVRLYTVTVTVSVTPPPTPPSGYTAGLLGWGFANNGVRFPWKGVTAFGTFSDALRPDRAHRAQRMLDHFAARGVTVPRILCTLAGTFWESRGFRIYPYEHPDYFPRLIQLVQYCNSLGMMPELVVFGAFLEIWPNDPQGMVNFVRQFATTMLPYRGFFVEMANEWDAIGFTSGESVRQLAREYLAVDPNRPVACSSATGDSDRYTGYLQEPSKYVTMHCARGGTSPDWLVNHFGNPTIMNGIRPAVSDEPVNAGYAALGIHEPDHQYWYTFGVMSRVMGWSTTFHYEPGLFTEPPVPGSAEESCFNAWMAGLNYPSPDEGGALFAATPAGVAFGPCPWPNSGSNRGLIGRTTASGTAYALCFGAATLPSTSAGWNAATADLITTGFLNVPGVPAGAFDTIRCYVVTPAGF